MSNQSLSLFLPFKLIRSSIHPRVSISKSELFVNIQTAIDFCGTNIYLLIRVLRFYKKARLIVNLELEIKGSFTKFFVLQYSLLSLYLIKFFIYLSKFAFPNTLFEINRYAGPIDSRFCGAKQAIEQVCRIMGNLLLFKVKYILKFS